MSRTSINIFISAAFFMTGLTSHAEGNNPKWKECSVDSDCIPIVELCGGAGAVNKKIIDDYYQYRNEVLGKASCSSGFVENKWQDEVKAACVNMKCIIKESSIQKPKILKSLSKTEIVSLKSLYGEIESNVSRGEYRSCFYNILKLKKVISSYENTDNHFYLCLQKIK